MGYLRFYMRYLSDGLGSHMPVKSDETCYRVDLSQNALLQLDCPHGLTHYIITPADFDDGNLADQIDWQCDANNTELILNGERRNMPFFTRMLPHISNMKTIPYQNELCVHVLHGKDRVDQKSILDLTALSHIGAVKVYRYDYEYDCEQGERLYEQGVTGSPFALAKLSVRQTEETDKQEEE